MFNCFHTNPTSRIHAPNNSSLARFRLNLNNTRDKRTSSFTLATTINKRSIFTSGCFHGLQPTRFRMVTKLRKRHLCRKDRVNNQVRVQIYRRRPFVRSSTSFTTKRFIHHEVMIHVSSRPRAHRHRVIQHLGLKVQRRDRRSINRQHTRGRTTSTMGSIIALNHVDRIRRMVHSLGHRITSRLQDRCMRGTTTPHRVLQFTNVRHLEDAHGSKRLRMITRCIIRVHVSKDHSSIFSSCLSRMLAKNITNLIVNVSHVVVPHSTMTHLNRTIFSVIMHVISLRQVQFTYHDLLRTMRFTMVTIMDPRRRRMVHANIRTFVGRQRAHIISLIGFFDHGYLTKHFNCFGRILTTFANRINALRRSRMTQFSVFARCGKTSEIFKDISLHFRLPHGLHASTRRSKFIITNLSMTR